jgi:hypothetical protein
MFWSAKHLPGTRTPKQLVVELENDTARTAREVRRRGGIEAFLQSL